MKCIFCCVFNEENYVKMFLILLESINIYGNLDENTDILVYTSTIFMNIIKESQWFIHNKIKFEINDTIDNIDKACKSRLDLFKFSCIVNYEKILYLDTDILIKNDISKVFDCSTQDVLYVLEEGLLTDNDGHYGGETLFNKEEIINYKDITAFSSGILLFNNCTKIVDLFNKINNDIINRPYNFSCYDQPYIVYNAFKYNLFDNKLLKTLIVNNDNNVFSNKVVHHFPGGPGIYKKKIDKMTIFLNKLNQINFKNDMKIYNVKSLPKKNTSISLIGLCVSYNYYDTIQFVLPVNYLHFEKIYLITQEDDIKTIEFAQRFDNIKILFFDFKNNNKNFDKFGAINYAQKIVYDKHPSDWYLIFDSDIILPNNFIDVLIKENLNSECIYGAIRNNVLKTSELLNKKMIVNKDENINFIYNNIVWCKKTPPSILGCFQLYKKKVFHRNDIENCGFGDYFFGHDNFNLFCNLENVLYFHLGETGQNWSGKTSYFLCDNNISLIDLHYNFHKKINNIYYDKNNNIVRYGSSKNINDDIWTCSEEMRYDIYKFFKDKTNFKIAEIGSHKGYTTKILANIFSKVYAVDNSVEWTKFNKKYNILSTNIEYVMLDIYKDNWEILPNDIEISFIDADHSYHGCKSDIINSIKTFKNLQYIIFDDYGVWQGVKQAVDEMIINKTLLFETFIGIKDVLGPNNIIVKNVNEGIICSINKNKTSYTSLNNSISLYRDFQNSNINMMHRKIKNNKINMLFTINYKINNY